MLKSRRSSTPSGSGRGGVEDGKNRPSKIPKKISSSSLQQFIQNEDAASSNPSAAYKKHHSTSSVPQKVQLFENSPNNKKNSKPKENGDISHYRKSVDEETKKWWDSVVESVFISDSNNVIRSFICFTAHSAKWINIIIYKILMVPEKVMTSHQLDNLSKLVSRCSHQLF